MRSNVWNWLRRFFSFGKRGGHPTPPDIRPVDMLQYRLEQWMHERKPFLKPGYTIKHLADDLHTPAWQLSAHLNQRMGLRFSDYMNQYRIKYCEQLIQSGGAVHLSMNEVAARCGFQNRTTFTNAFQKFTGQSFVEYTKRYFKF